MKTSEKSEVGLGCALLSHPALQQCYVWRCCSTYCADHRPRQAPASPRKRRSMAPTCAICACDVETSAPNDDVLLVTCCQHTLLHRDCLQVTDGIW